VLWVYWPVTGHSFISLDDPEYVTSNTHIQGGLTWENIKWAFANPVVGNWHPVTMMSHMLDCQLYGLKPWGHHLTTLILHTANTVLLFLLLHRLTSATWRSLIVAAFFGLHPLHVESVAWVAERKDVLSTFFGFLCLMAYSCYATGNPRSKGFYGLAVILFALGLMSKPMLVTLPFVLLLLDYWPLGRMNRSGFEFQEWRGVIIEKIPFFVLTLAVCVVTFLVQRPGATGALENISFSDKIENAVVSYGAYIWKLFWPAKLAVFYPYHYGWSMEWVLSSTALIIMMSLLCLVERRRRPYFLVGWLWYLGTLIPVIGLVQVGAQAMADRYLYIPSIGLLIVVVWGGAEWAARWPCFQIIVGTTCCATIILCAEETRQQLGYWQNNETLYRHAIKVTSDNYLMHYFLGVTLANEGKMDDAISEYEQAIRIKPDYAAEHCDYAEALAINGQANEAISEFQAAIRLKPDYDKAFSGLGTVLGRMGRTEEAIAAYRTAISLKPDNARYHYDLGLVLLIDNQVNSGIAQFQEAIRLKPDFAEAQHYLGVALQVKNGSQKISP